MVPETSVNITEKLQKIGETAQNYKDALLINLRTWKWKLRIGTSLSERWIKNTC